MTKFKLPKGYSFDPPADHPSVLIGGQKLYGGADISDAYDAAGTHWTWCLATGPDGLFRYRAFWQKQGETLWSEQKLPDSVDGRGNADVQWWDGKAHYSAWMGAQFYQNTVPNFQPFPSIPSLDKRIAALEGGSISTPTPAHPIPIPPGGAIAALWPLAYGPSEVDTPEEVAVKFNKLKAAFFELLMLVKEAGVLA